MYCPHKKPSKYILEGIIRRHKNTIITGDFNSKHEDIGHENSSTLIKTINEHNYTIHNDNGPTYTNGRTGNQDVKYLMLSSPGMIKKLLDFWVDEDLGSDHNINTIIIQDYNNPNQQKQSNCTTKQTGDINNTILTQMEDHHPDKSSRKDINRYITTLEQNLTTKYVKDKQIGLPKLI